MSQPGILIVEDEAIVASDLANKIRRLGYDVTGIAGTGADAVAQARAQRPALVLMDIHLTEAMDGITSAEAIQQERPVPVIFLTAHSDTATVERARQANPFAYVLKPFDMRELHIHIELALYKETAERRLRESEERLAGIVGSAMDAIISVNDAQRVVLFNAAAEAMFGLTAAAAFGQPLELFIPERFHRAHAAHFDQFTQTGVTGRRMGGLGEISGRRADGAEFPIEAAISQVAVAGGKLYTVILRDITERKKAEAALRELNATLEQRVQERTAALQESEARFRQMAENVQEVVWLASADLSQVLYLSPAFEKIWGHSCQSVYANPRLWLAAIHPEDRPGTKQAFLSQQTTGTPARAEYRIIRPDGSVRWIADHSTLVRNEAGQPYRLAGVARDITERKEAELTRARLAAIVETSTDAISAMDMNGVITDWTESAERLYGFTAAEAVGKPISLIVPPDKQSDIPLFIQKLKRGDRIASYETVRVRKDGQRFDASITISPLRDATGRIAHSSGITRDITERKRLEAEIQRISEAEKQQLGRDLHDGLSQHLTGVRYMASTLQAILVRKASPEAADAAQIVRELTTAVHEARDLVRGLVPVVLRSGDIVPALQELAVIATSLYKVSCRVVAPREIHIADADAARQLYRIAQEAINNAAKHSHGKHITVRVVKQRGRTILTVRDDGVGLPKKLPEHTRLGLRIMQYRAGLLNAHLKIARAPGGGTLVTCTFGQPCADARCVVTSNGSGSEVDVLQPDRKKLTGVS